MAQQQNSATTLLAFANVVLVFFLIIRLRVNPADVQKEIVKAKSEIRIELNELKADMHNVQHLMAERKDWLEKLTIILQDKMAIDIPRVP